MPGKRGQRPFEPTKQQLEQVWASAALGMTVEQMTLGMVNPKTNRPIGISTFRRHFADIIATAKAQSAMLISAKLFEGMRTGKVNSHAIFLGKVHPLLQLKEVSRNEQTGAGGGPIQNQTQIIPAPSLTDLASRTDQELARMHQDAMNSNAA